MGLLDVDICGPSIPKLMGLEGQQVINSAQGWVPLRYLHDSFLCVGNLIGEISALLILLPDMHLTNCL